MLVATLMGDVAASPVYGGGEPPGLERAIEVQEKYNQQLMAMPLVVGTGVGLTAEGLPAVKVFTRIPGASVLRALEGVPVEVEVTGMFVARSDPTTGFARPVPIGVSTGHPDITAGTIGARVKDAQGNVYALSNNHVYANGNDAKIGDSALQPGPYDGGSEPDDVIGNLYDFEPIKFDGSDNYIDAAIASSTTSLVGYSTPSDGYGTPSSTTVSAYPDLPAVQKYGRTTGWTHGSVSGINVTVDVCYEVQCNPVSCRCKKSARFVDQIAITSGEFSAGGDSGSLIVTDDESKNPVGLLFAGSDTHTIANPIDLVLNRFNVSIDDGTPPEPVTDIAITAVDAPSSVVQGDVVDVNVTVENVGNQDVTSTITITLTDDTDNVTIGTKTISGLAAGASTTPTFSWDTTGATIGDHTLTASHDFADDDATNDSKSVTVTISEGADTMHVSAIDMWYVKRGPNYFVYTKVTIVDESGYPVSDATVYLTTMLPDGSTVSDSGITGGDGTMTFSVKSQQTGTYTSEVTDVIHASLTYDSAANLETSESLTVP